MLYTYFAYLEYALLELTLLSLAIELYLAFSSVLFRLRSHSVHSTAFVPVESYTSAGGIPKAFSQVAGPQDGPMLLLNPAPAQQACQEPP